MKNTFIVYTDNIEYLEELTDEQIGKLYKAQIAYARGEELAIDDSVVRLVFKMIKGQMDRDAEKYEQAVNRRSEAGKRGMSNRWNKSGDTAKGETDTDEVITNDNNVISAITNDNNVINDIASDNNVISDITTDNSVINGITKITDTDTVTDNDTDTVNDKEKRVKEKARRACFTPPSVDEVREYITEKGYNINPESFVDFYQSKGWLVGNVKMKDWRAAVRTWKNRNTRSPSISPPNKFKNFTQRENSDLDKKAEEKSLKMLGFA